MPSGILLDFLVARDPRPEVVTASFKDGIEEISDLKPEMILEGVYELNYKTLAHKGQLTGRLKMSFVFES